MVCHSFAPLVVLLTALLFMQVRCSPVIIQKRGICATEDPDASFLQAIQRVKAEESRPDPSASEARQGPIEVATWFHIITSKAEADQVSDDMINAQVNNAIPPVYHGFSVLTLLQFSILQDSYEDAGISYRLHGITRHVNDTWARNDDEIAMKTALRKGSYQTLNVYFQTDLQGTPGETGRHRHQAAHISADLSSSVLGFCTLPDPSINASTPRTSYIKDGCNVLAKTMPGGSLDLYNRGGTAIHEIGHWHGLLHTFQGDSCSPHNPGDYIADTPQQSSPTEGCPARRNSCPGVPGVDLIHDFMDYASDVCYESFTAGQVRRMRKMWASMREGK